MKQQVDGVASTFHRMLGGMYGADLHFPNNALKSERYRVSWRATPDEDGQYVYAIALR